MATKTKDAQLLELVEPQFITLTERPANKTGFKVLRSAHGQEEEIRRRRKAKRGDENLLAIELPLGITRDEAEIYLEQYSLSEEYSITGDEESGFVLRRSGISIPENATRMDLGSGVVAILSPGTFARSDDVKVTGITLVGVEFDNEFTEESAKSWLDDKNIAFREDGLIAENGLITATRYEVPDGQELRRVDIEENVTGLVARTESVDIPAKVYRSVIEEAYGNWGWGSLDFSQAVADAEFTELARDSVWVLYDVLENILFYSWLPIDERKTLVSNACVQFSNYIASLIDALPREVARQARAEKLNVNQETDMATKDETGKTTTQRNDEQGKEKEAHGTAVEQGQENTPEYMTREDVSTIIGEQLQTHFSPENMKEMFGQAFGMKRAEEEEEIDPTLKAIQDLTESVNGINEKVSGIEEVQATMRSEMDEFGNTTVKRTDETDENTVEGDGEKSTKRTDDVFAGLFGSVQ